MLDFNNIKKCCTEEPNLHTKQLLRKELLNSKFIDNNETIHIGIIYHVCYQNYNKIAVDLDIQHVTNILNQDFNKNASNFNNGASIYKYKIPSIKFYKLFKYRKKYKLIRITRRIRRNRRRFRRILRLNRRRRRLNIRINRYNKRRRRINKKRIIANRKRLRILNKYKKIYKTII